MARTIKLREFSTFLDKSKVQYNQKKGTEVIVPASVEFIQPNQCLVIDESSNLMCIDIDTKSTEGEQASSSEVLSLLAGSTGLAIEEEIYTEKTKSDGLHLIFFCSDELLLAFEKKLKKKAYFCEIDLLDKNITFAVDIFNKFTYSEHIVITVPNQINNKKYMPISSDKAIKEISQDLLEELLFFLERNEIKKPTKDEIIQVNTNETPPTQLKEYLDSFVEYIENYGLRCFLSAINETNYSYWLKILFICSVNNEKEMFLNFCSRVPCDLKNTAFNREIESKKYDRESKKTHTVQANCLFIWYHYLYTSKDLSDFYLDNTKKIEEIKEVEETKEEEEEEEEDINKLFYIEYLKEMPEYFIELVEYIKSCLGKKQNNDIVALELAIFIIGVLLQNIVYIDCGKNFKITFHQFFACIGNAFTGKSAILDVVIDILYNFNYQNTQSPYIKNIAFFNKTLASVQKYRAYLYLPTKRNNIVIYDESFKHDAIKYLYNNENKKISGNAMQLGLEFQENFGKFCSQKGEGGSITNGTLYAVDGISTSLLMFNTFKDIIDVNPKGGGLSRIKHIKIGERVEEKKNLSFDYLEKYNNTNISQEIFKDDNKINENILINISKLINKYKDFDCEELEKKVNLYKYEEVKGKMIKIKKSTDELNKEYSRISLKGQEKKYNITTGCAAIFKQIHEESIEINNQDIYARRILFSNKIYCLKYIIQDKVIDYDSNFYPLCCKYNTNSILEFTKIIKENENEPNNEVEKINIKILEEVESVYAKLKNEFYVSDFIKNSRSLQKHKTTDVRNCISMFLESKAEPIKGKKWKKNI